MTCENREIKELLDLYVEGVLEKHDVSCVEEHLLFCPSCRAEVELLVALKAEPVPDPGAAFWAQLPEKIHAQLDKETQKKETPPTEQSLWPAQIRRWAWGMIPVAVAAGITLVILLRPPAGSGPSMVKDDDLASEVALSEPIVIEELSAAELSQIAGWTGGELANIDKQAACILADSNMVADEPASVTIAELTPEELDRLDRLLTAEFRHKQG